MSTSDFGGRGSDRMLTRDQIEDQFREGYRTISVDDAGPFFDLLDLDDVRIVSFWVRGQPDPDALGGVIHTTQKTVGQVVGVLAASNTLQLRMSVSVLPYGSAQVDFYTPSMSFPGGQPSPDVLSPKG